MNRVEHLFISVATQLIFPSCPSPSASMDQSFGSVYEVLLADILAA